MAPKLHPFSLKTSPPASKVMKINWTFLIGASLTLVLAMNLVFQWEPIEAKKVKKEKLLKSLFKGLLVKQLSVKKNFLPLPVPIPVRIELSEPPIYLKGKPRYVTVYKPTEKPKNVYQMPLYVPSNDYMLNPYDSLYGSMMVSGENPTSYYGSSGGIGTTKSGTSYDSNANNKAGKSSDAPKATKPTGNSQTNVAGKNANSGRAASSVKSKSGAGSAGAQNSAPTTHKKSGPKDVKTESSVVRGKLTIDFTDFDDDSGSYYLTKLPMPNGKTKLANYLMLHRADFKRSSSTHPYDTDDDVELASMSRADDDESVDQDEKLNKRRVKRQISYTSNYRKPCFGFPLEINIRSRIKPEDVFPIYGRSQIKKCIDFTKPKPTFQPIEEHYPGY